MHLVKVHERRGGRIVSVKVLCDGRVVALPGTPATLKDALPEGHTAHKGEVRCPDCLWAIVRGLEAEVKSWSRAWHEQRELASHNWGSCLICDRAVPHTCPGCLANQEGPPRPTAYRVVTPEEGAADLGRWLAARLNAP